MDWTRPSIHCDQNQRIKKELERCRFWFTQNSRTPWLSYNFKHCQIGTPFNSGKKNYRHILHWQTSRPTFQLSFLHFSTFLSHLSKFLVCSCLPTILGISSPTLFSSFICLSTAVFPRRVRKWSATGNE